MKISRKNFVIFTLLIIVVFATPRKIGTKTEEIVSNTDPLPPAMGVYEKWSYFINEDIRSSPAVADLDADGTFEVLVGSYDDKLYCFNHLGTEEWNYTTGYDIQSSPAVTDLDGDGTLEVLVGSLDSNIYCVNHTGVLEWSYTTMGSVYSSPVVVDIDMDG